MRYKIWTLILLFFSINFLYSQQEVNYALHKRHFNIINPGVAGVGESTYMNLSIRTQWTGIKNAPETQAFSHSVPCRNKKVGLGFTVINDKISIERQTQLFADFSYQLDFNRDTSLYLGFKGGGNLFRLLGDDASIYDENGLIIDPEIRTFSRFLPNVGVGIYLENPDKFFLSLSVPRILNTKRFKEQDGQITTATDRPHYFTSAGIHLHTSQNWTITPSYLWAVVKDAPSSFVCDLGFSFQNVFDFGVQYTNSQSLGGNAFLKLSESLQFGYAYKSPINSQLPASALATHEIVLRVTLNN